ncbi:MAG: tRNA uridine-5-carboxymethylaminomethyl(34) synthesis enzyme MnmG [Bacteroidota bacterium]
MFHTHYDLIVVGLGHAGAECAHAAAKMGAKVLGIDPNRGFVKMSCNNAIGGIAKGQIVREIDALGGLQGIIADRSTIQFRMLNQSKGPAMWSPRSQNDTLVFGTTWQKALETLPNLDFWQDMVHSLIIKQKKVAGIKTTSGIEIKSKAVILTAGTFLNGLIHIGKRTFGGGRIDEKAALGIGGQLLEHGFEIGRMNTGTPPRVDGRSINYSKMQEQPSDAQKIQFSFLDHRAHQTLPQKSVYITCTNPIVHEFLAKQFHHTPNLNGNVEGKGPEYCISIETKIKRFSNKKQHQIFVQPMSASTSEVYLNGFTTAFPEEVQYQALQKIDGFENIKMFRPGYTVEYDYFPPTQLKLTLETKLIENLYFAGQINGTTGYEEAACQGLMAGINAYLKIKNQAPFILKRSEAYIGVLIDDLVHKGTQGDPYRMFTSRAEHRMLLRQDNADLRLTEKAYQIGLASQARYQKMTTKQNETKALIQKLTHTKITPTQINPLLNTLKNSPIYESQSLYQLIKRPQLNLHLLAGSTPTLKSMFAPYTKEVLTQAEIQIKYAEYLEKEKILVKKMAELENYPLPYDLDYQLIKNISNEAKAKLQHIQPTTLGAASRISGVSPSDIAILMIYLGK